MVNGHMKLQSFLTKMDELRIQYQNVNLLDLEYTPLKWLLGKVVPYLLLKCKLF